MAVSLATSSFTFRELLQQILPTLIAVCLFTPFFEATYKKNVDLTTVVFGSIVLSYLITAPARHFADILLRRLPKIGRSERRARWMQNNWDFERLTVCLSKDEYELVELIGNYALFYKALSFYLAAYCVFNLYWFLSYFGLLPPSQYGSLLTAEYWGRMLQACWAVGTPILGGWEFWTPGALLVTACSVYFMLESYVGNNQYLFSEHGMYTVLAEKYQKEKGGLARRVWGRLVCGGPLGSTRVRLVKSTYYWTPDGENTELLDAEVDGHGYFHFDSKYVDALDADWRLSVEADGFKWSKAVKFTETTTPYFIVEVLPPPGHNPAP